MPKTVTRLASRAGLKPAQVVGEKQKPKTCYESNKEVWSSNHQRCIEQGWTDNSLCSNQFLNEKVNKAKGLKQREL